VGRRAALEVERKRRVLPAAGGMTTSLSLRHRHRALRDVLLGHSLDIKNAGAVKKGGIVEQGVLIKTRVKNAIAYQR